MAYTGPAFRSADGVLSASAYSTVTITKPSGTAEGDFLIAFIEHWHNTEDLTSRTITATGWTEHQVAWPVGNLVRDAVYYKVAGASEPASYDFVISGTPTMDGSSGGIVCIGTSGCGIVAGPTATTGAGTNPDPPASGTVTLGDYLAVVGTLCGNQSSQVPPTNYTERVDLSWTAMATRELDDVTSENPGTYGNAVSEWSAYTYLIGVTTALQTLKPDADTADGGWATTPLWSKVDDDPASPDATVISATSA